MCYKLAPIFCRPWLLNGLSTRLIESHYENNYGGALRRLNAITEKLESLDFTKTPGYVINGLKREELTALNSTLLHELYFASLGVAPVAKGRNIPRPTGALAEALARDFGSFERWRDEFVAMPRPMPAPTLSGGGLMKAAVTPPTTLPPRASTELCIPRGAHLHEPEYDALWQLASELDFPISAHVGNFQE